MKPKYRYEPVEAIAHLRAGDEVLAGVMDRIGPFTLELKPAASLFEALLRSIVHQQLNGNAAAAIHGRVLAALDRHGGPTAEALARASDEELRAAGLSRGKLAAARDLGAKCLAGVVPTLRQSHALTDEELLARLTAVRGIGPWTVHMLLIFHLGRPDVMPTGDLGIRMAFKKIYRKRRDPKPGVILKHARRWQPYRTIASWYLWRSLD